MYIYIEKLGHRLQMIGNILYTKSKNFKVRTSKYFLPAPLLLFAVCDLSISCCFSIGISSRGYGFFLKLLLSPITGFNSSSRESLFSNDDAGINFQSSVVRGWMYRREGGPISRRRLRQILYLKKCNIS